jgi:hypothetical protein
MSCDREALELFSSLDEAAERPLRLRIAPLRRPEEVDRRVAEPIDLQPQRGRLWQVAGIRLFMHCTIDMAPLGLRSPAVMASRPARTGRTR